MKAWTIVAATTLLAGCGGVGEPADVAKNAAMPTATSTPATVNGVTKPTGLDRYLGKYPSDKLDGHSFMSEPAVRAAVERASDDPAIRRFVLEGSGPESPIALQDGKITAWGCEQHNCGDHNWTVQMSSDGKAGGLCIEDARRGQATWYADGKPERRSATCPEAG